MSAPDSRPTLGLWMTTALVIGNTVGSGIFLLPAVLGAYGSISLVAWLFTATGSLMCALVFARLSRRLPRAGGPYAYTREGFGEFTGFLVAWGYWISCWTTNAALAVAMVSYLTVFWAPLGTNALLAGVTAVGSIWLLTFVNALGVRPVGMLQVATTVLKLTPLVGVAAFGLFYLDTSNFVPFNASELSAGNALTACVALTLWAFLGIESATIPAEHISHPERTISRATLMGTGGIAVLYIAGTAAVMGILPQSRLAASTAPFADAAEAIWGSWAGYAVAAGAILSCFGALNGWILNTAQISQAVAKDRLFPEVFGRLSRRGMPLFGLLVSSILATLLVAVNYTKGLVEQFTFIILLATMTALVPYVFSAASSLIQMSRDRKERGRQLSRAALMVSVLAFLYSVWAIAGAGHEIVYWGFLLLLAGIPVYIFMRWNGSTAPPEPKG
jgi:APA family basic amino acid/polyamine antiporter